MPEKGKKLKTQNKKTMAKEQAIAELKTAKDVQEWNQIRAKWTQLLKPTELCAIDASGLIVEVLGPDPFSNPDYEY